MVFNNSVNGSNNDFELSSGTLQFANRTRLRGGYAENIGISYSGSTFTVLGSDGNALSATNPGYINIQSTTSGQEKKIAVTANQTFTDGSAGTTDNQRFGLTTGRNAANDMPFYLYAVLNDAQDTINFMIARLPNAYRSPASTSIGKTGAVVNVGQGDFFSLGNITVADYDQNPCLCIGSFRMQFVGATDSWTVQTLAEGQDGIGRFQQGVQFAVPLGHFGAAAGKWFLDNGGTAPHDTGGGYDYIINPNGLVISSIAFPSVTTGGVGAVTAKIATPFAPLQGGINSQGFLVNANTLTISGNQIAGVTNTQDMRFYQVPGTLSIQNASLSLTSLFGLQINYYIQVTA